MKTLILESDDIFSRLSVAMTSSDKQWCTEIGDN